MMTRETQQSMQTKSSGRLRRSKKALLNLALTAICGPAVQAFQASSPFHLSRRRCQAPFSVTLFGKPVKVVDVEAEVVSVDKEEPGEDFSSKVVVTKVQEDQTLYMEEDSEKLTFDDDDTRKKYIILGLLWLTTCLAALDRVAMSVALVPMTEEFGLSSTVKGSISSVFSLGYGLFILPAGLLVGNLSPRAVMMSGIALWSVATIATPVAAGALAIGMAPLFLARACVGAGESIVIPSTQRFLSVWTSPEEKSRALAFVLSGFQFGKIGAYLLSPVLMEVLGGWRQLFYTYGGLGILILLPWLFLAQDDPSGKKVIATSSTALDASNEENALSPVDEAKRVLQEAPWKEMAKSKGVWAMLLAHSAKNWGIYNWLAWTPTFYAEQYGIGVKDSAWLMVLPSVAGAAGGFVAGITADKVVQNMKDPADDKEKTRIRNIFQSVGLFGPAIAMAALSWEIPEQAWIAQSFLAAAFCMQAFNAGGFEAANQEKAGPRWAGLLYSITSLPGVLIGTGGVYITGRILDATGQDWSIVFGINAIINILGASAFIALYDSKKEFD